MEPNTSKSQPPTGVNRRAFLNRSALTALAASIGSGVAPFAIGQGAGDAASRLGVGVIGCGGRGSYLINVIKQLIADGENVAITAVCDTYRPRLNRAAEATGANAYMDHHDLLADPDVDVVFVATCDHHHGYQVIDAARAGKDVYCEKPVTHWRQYELLREMTREIKAHGRVFQAGTQGMSDGAWHKMKQLVDEGLIGQPLFAECGYFRVGDWGERGMPIDDPNARPGPDLDWQAFLGDAPKRPFDVSRYFRWRMYEDYAGGPVTDLYPHSLTPVTSILGAGFPMSVVASGGKMRYAIREVPDTFNMFIDYPEKYTISLTGTQGNNYVTEGQRGAGSRIPVIRGWEGSLTIDRSKNEIAFIPNQESGGSHQSFPIEYGEDMGRFVQNFFDCARRGDPNTYSPIDLAYRTQTALIMGMLAFRNGRTARFDTNREDIVL